MRGELSGYPDIMNDPGSAIGGGEFRCVTRPDFDGLVCAVLLRALGVVDSIVFVSPKEIQDGEFPVTARDIICNLPHDPRGALTVDHHLSELYRLPENHGNRVLNAKAKSGAQVVADHFGVPVNLPSRYADMVAMANKIDTADFTRDEVLAPTGWVLLGLLLDPRTDPGVSWGSHERRNEFFLRLVDLLVTADIDGILATPEVHERAEMYFAQERRCKKQIAQYARLVDNLVILDLRGVSPIYHGNRFLIYAMYPNVELSLHLIEHISKPVIVFAVGKSIFRRTSQLNIGKLMLEYGGGGHANAGTCQIPAGRADAALEEMIPKLIAKQG